MFWLRLVRHICGLRMWGFPVLAIGRVQDHSILHQYFHFPSTIFLFLRAGGRFGWFVFTTMRLAGDRARRFHCFREIVLSHGGGVPIRPIQIRPLEVFPYEYRIARGKIQNDQSQNHKRVYSHHAPAPASWIFRIALLLLAVRDDRHGHHA